MSREAFDIEAALEKCHAGTAWQRDLIRAQMIAAQSDAFERAAAAAKSELLVDARDGEEYDMGHNDGILIAVGAIRALAKEAT